MTNLASDKKTRKNIKKRTKKKTLKNKTKKKYGIPDDFGQLREIIPLIEYVAKRKVDGMTKASDYPPKHPLRKELTKEYKRRLKIFNKKAKYRNILKKHTKKNIDKLSLPQIEKYYFLLLNS